MVPKSSQDEALIQYSISREVPRSILTYETVLGTLDATPKVPRHAWFPRGENLGSRHRFLLAPSPLLIATGEAIPLRGLEGVPGLPGAPQEEAGLTRTFEMSHVGGATCGTTPIPRSALEKNPMTYPSSKATLWVKAQT